mmetsp:Transcript_33309/g.68772  ORF Transcript_33309/g.68772 Transcript_33309/m.68772 type:complete len:365 (+) Transcript_33309:716-1810(+)
MGKHHFAVGVADAVQVRHHGAVRLVEDLHLLVHLHKATVGLNAMLLQLQPLRVRHTPSAHESSVDEEGAVRHFLLRLRVDQLDLHGLLSRLPRHHLSGKHAGVTVNLPRLDQHPVRHPADLGVEGGHERVHRLDERDLRAQRCVHVRELKANVPTPNDRHPIGHPLKLQRVVRCEHCLAIDLDAGRHEGDGAGGEDDVLGCHNLVCACLTHLVGASVLASLLDDVDAQRRERVAQVHRHVARELTGVLSNGLAVVLDAVNGNAKPLQVVCVLHLPHTSCGSEESLRRHTSAVDARPPDISARENRRLQALAPGMERRSMAADTASDDENIIIELSIGHHLEGSHPGCCARIAQDRLARESCGSR